MNASTALSAIRWLIRDTFLQSLSAGIFWVMLLLSGLSILLCLSAGVSDKGLTLLFGAYQVAPGQAAPQAVRSLQLLLAGGVADVTGLLLALVWTAGFLPAFLEPSAAAVLLAKPVPRWALLVGKYLGVLTFVAFQAVVFVGGTWLALGLRTGYWAPVYLLGAPLLLLHFAIFYSFSAFLAVSTYSTVASVFGSLLFWVVCWGMNFGRHAVVTLGPLPEMSPVLYGIMEVGYWLFPKPADLGILLDRAFGAGSYFGETPLVQAVQGAALGWSVLTSLGFTLVVLALAVYQFVMTDY